MKATPTLEGRVLEALRVSKDWDQKDLAAALGVKANLISEYERGRKALSRGRLEDLVAELGYAPAAIDRTVVWAAELPPLEPDGGEEDPEVEMRRAVDRAVAVLAEAARPVLVQAARAAQAARKRAEAAELMAVLRPLPPAEQRVLVEKDPAFHRWAVCEALCAASEQAAPADAKRSLHLARLACVVAENARDVEGWRPLLQAYAAAFLGNAWRVAGDLNASDRAFEAVHRFLKEPVAGAPELLDEGRRIDLEASLRRAQGNFEAALALHGEALEKTPQAKSGYILLAKSATLHQMGDDEGARAILRQAILLVSRSREPRLLSVTYFNLVASLLQAGKSEDAAALLPEVRELAVQLRNDLDVARVRWLEGRIAAARGELELAAEAIGEAYHEFDRRGIAYDSAVAGLHLAEIFLRLGRPAAVKELAGSSGAVLGSQGVAGGAHAAWLLFCEAVEQEAVSIDMVQRLTRDLEQGTQRA